jgi:transposase
MPRIATLNLLAEDQLRLSKIVERGEDWRMRQRSNTLLHLNKGLSMREVAIAVGIHIRTVGLTRMDWLRRGYDSLKDAVRSGAPKKISPEELLRLQEAAIAEPLTATSLLARHLEAGGKPVHVNTIKGALKRAKFVWKRTRSSLKNKRNEEDFRAAAIEIEQLRKKAAAEDSVLAFCDEAGLSRVHPNRGAWTPVGQQHLIPAIRGQRLNVLAAMLSTGELFSVTYTESTTAEIFMGFIGLLKEHVGKKLKVIIDNASIHKAKAMKPVVELLEKAGVTFYFLPPYSPELNRIETLWRLMKHTWMEVKCRDMETLKADVQEILDNFGTKYKLSF